MSALTRQFKHALVPVAVLLMVAMVTAMRPAPSALEQIQARGELVVATRLAPTTYYHDQHGATGLEYELAAGFARELGVELRMLETDTLEDIFLAVRDGRADLAAAGLTISPRRKLQFDFSTGYQTVQEQIIYRLGEPRPRNISDLAGRRIVVLAGSSHAEQLALLQQEVPFLDVEELPGASAEQLLSRVHDGQADYTMVDSNAYLMHRALFPELVSAFDASEAQLGWAFRREPQAQLYQAAQRYLTRVKADGTVARLEQRFYGHAERFNLYAARSFIRHLDHRLPEYATAFRDAGDTTGFDWRLLAAVGYQESMWDPAAVSPTGVRGLMMLTRNTAAEMGVSDREDPLQSIHAGAAYLRKLHDRLPERIGEPDRTWMAIAAYNAGIGHLEDARVLTQRQGGNPDLWADVRGRLPLLRQPQYYRDARHGYASGGGQAVVYVRAIRAYYDTLVWATNTQRHSDMLLAMAQPAPQASGNL